MCTIFHPSRSSSTKGMMTIASILGVDGGSIKDVGIPYLGIHAGLMVNHIMHSTLTLPSSSR